MNPHLCPDCGQPWKAQATGKRGAHKVRATVCDSCFSASETSKDRMVALTAVKVVMAQYAKPPCDLQRVFMMRRATEAVREVRVTAWRLLVRLGWGVMRIARAFGCSHATVIANLRTMEMHRA